MLFPGTSLLPAAEIYFLTFVVSSNAELIAFVRYRYWFEPHLKLQTDLLVMSTHSELGVDIRLALLLVQS